MRNNTVFILTAVICCGLFVSGCKEGLSGYSTGWPYPDNVSTIYVEMFDSSSFRRGYEVTLTNALCKRIEVETPYKIISDRDLADTVLTGRIRGIGQSVLTRDPYSGRPLERETIVSVEVNWKNLQNGRLLINSQSVYGSATYSDKLDPAQTFDYSADIAVNRAAERIVELMQEKWQ